MFQVVFSLSCLCSVGTFGFGPKQPKDILHKALVVRINTSTWPMSVKSSPGAAMARYDVLCIKEDNNDTFFFNKVCKTNDFASELKLESIPTYMREKA